jgi:hypothetical protein
MVAQHRSEHKCRGMILEISGNIADPQPAVGIADILQSLRRYLGNLGSDLNPPLLASLLMLGKFRAREEIEREDLPGDRPFIVGLHGQRPIVQLDRFLDLALMRYTLGKSRERLDRSRIVADGSLANLHCFRQLAKADQQPGVAERGFQIGAMARALP